MTEEELQNFLSSHPNRVYDKDKGRVREKTADEKLKENVEINKEEKKKKGKKNKYFNIKVYEYENGFVSVEKDLKNNGKIVTVYDSKKEFRRWNELLSMQNMGEITGLQRQVKLVIQEAFVYQGKKIAAIVYKADHVYIKDGITVVEDVKTFDNKTKKFRTTKDFNLKWKLLKKRYPDYSFELY